MSTMEFSKMYESNYDALKNFAFKLTMDPVKAEDLVQDTAMKALKGFHTFKLGSNFKSWMFTILKNSFISNYHRNKKRSVVRKPIEDFTYALENKYAVDNNAVSKLRIKEIKNEISNLSDTSKIPFLMYVNGYQYKEIASSLDIPIGTVKSRINYARTKLKERLANVFPNA